MLISLFVHLLLRRDLLLPSRRRLASWCCLNLSLMLDQELASEPNDAIGLLHSRGIYILVEMTELRAWF